MGEWPRQTLYRLLLKSNPTRARTLRAVRAGFPASQTSQAVSKVENEYTQIRRQAAVSCSDMWRMGNLHWDI